MKTLFSIINLSQAWRTKKQKSRAAGRFENQSSYSLRRQKNLKKSLSHDKFFKFVWPFSEKLSFTYKVFWMKRFCFYFCINMCISFFVALFCAIFELWICPLDFFQMNCGNSISNCFSVPPSAPWFH